MSSIFSVTLRMYFFAYFMRRSDIVFIFVENYPLIMLLMDVINEFRTYAKYTICYVGKSILILFSDAGI